MQNEAPLVPSTDQKEKNNNLFSEAIPYDILVEQNEAGIFCLKNEIISYANKAFLEVLGIEEQAVLGTSILEQVAEADRSILEEGLEKMIKGEALRFSKDLQLNRTSEKVTYFSLHLKVLKREEAGVKIIGASREATSRVLKNIELNQTKSMYEALYHNTLEGVIIYDYAQEKITDHNKRALELMGYEKSENLLKVNRFQFVPQYTNYYPGIDAHKETENDGRRVMNGEAFKAAGVFSKEDGTHIFVRANVVPTFRRYGEAFIFFEDITSKQRARKKQKETEQKYRDVFENSHEAIIYLDAKTRLPLLCNDRALKLFGVASFEDFLKFKVNDFFIEAVVDGAPKENHIQDVFDRAIAMGRAEISQWIRKKTGEVVHVSVVMISDTVDKGRPKVIAFIRDITHLHEAQTALNEKNKELKKYIDSNLQLENFAYFASHDLQTPLRSIISFTQLLQRKMKGRLSEAEQDYMNFIISSSKNMRGLVNDLLSYSRVNTTKINIEAVNLKEMLEQLCQEMDTMITDKKATIHLENIPEQIFLDALKMRQVFQNLMTNALKFTKPDLDPEVIIHCKEEAEQWRFFVRDNGIGIAPEFQGKIFLLFKRLHGNAEYEGTGIGLAMVKKIVEQHTGSIWLESSEGQGATFWFTIKKYQQ